MIMYTVVTIFGIIILYDSESFNHIYLVIKLVIINFSDNFFFSTVGESTTDLLIGPKE